MVRWMRFSVGALLALALWVTGVVVVSAGNSFVRSELRIDYPDVYSASQYRAWLAPIGLPYSGDLRDFTATWLGVFLGQYNGQPGSGRFS